YGRILKERRSLYAGCDLLEQLQPFRGDAVVTQHKTSSVCRPAERGFHETGADWFGDLHENDRYGAWPRFHRGSSRDNHQQEGAGPKEIKPSRHGVGMFLLLVQQQ